MYKILHNLDRFFWAITQLAIGWTVVVLALAWPVLWLVILGLLLKGGAKKLTDLGRAKWASESDLAGMLDADSGLILGRLS